MMDNRAEPHQNRLLARIDGTGNLFANVTDVVPPGFQPQILSYPNDQLLDYDSLATFVHGSLPKQEDFVLVAESFSGPIAIEIAARRPPRLRAVILVASFITSPIKGLSAAIKAALTIPFPSVLPHWLARRIFFDSEVPASLIAQFTAVLKTIPPALLRYRVNCILNVDVREKFKECPVPILYLQGSKDSLIPKQVSLQMQKLQPLMSIRPLDVGHLVLQSAPAVSLGLISEFIQAIAPTDSTKRESPHIF